ncbi:hypothetical protein [Rhodobacter sp. NSM]|uniref:hypothetical protein n=1 Tax=Rhodobacter sp. NSM TaxID=3457501 RepID=UPI003FD44198
MDLTQVRIEAGVWEGLLVAAGEAPQLEVMHLGEVVAVPEILAIPNRSGQWTVRVPIPVQLLSEGIHTFLVREAGVAGKLAHFTIVAGAPLDQDVLSEVVLLRAELDLLKQAFRRHCREGDV